MSRRDKIVAWARDRLERHERDLDTLLTHLYGERPQTADVESDPELEGIIRALEDQKAHVQATRDRLEGRIDSVA
jgi:hypothetical protein